MQARMAQILRRRGSAPAVDCRQLRCLFVQECWFILLCLDLVALPGCTSLPVAKYRDLPSCMAVARGGGRMALTRLRGGGENEAARQRDDADIAQRRER